MPVANSCAASISSSASCRSRVLFTSQPGSSDARGALSATLIQLFRRTSYNLALDPLGISAATISTRLGTVRRTACSTTPRADGVSPCAPRITTTRYSESKGGVPISDASVAASASSPLI